MTVVVLELELDGSEFKVPVLFSSYTALSQAGAESAVIRYDQFLVTLTVALHCA